MVVDIPVRMIITCLDGVLGAGTLQRSVNVHVSRGCGMFLIRSPVDRVHETEDDKQHTLTLALELGGGA